MLPRAWVPAGAGGTQHHVPGGSSAAHGATTLAGSWRSHPSGLLPQVGGVAAGMLPLRTTTHSHPALHPLPTSSDVRCLATGKDADRGAAGAAAKPGRPISKATKLFQKRVAERQLQMQDNSKDAWYESAGDGDDADEDGSRRQQKRGLAVQPPPPPRPSASAAREGPLGGQVTAPTRFTQLFSSKTGKASSSSSGSGRRTDSASGPAVEFQTNSLYVDGYDGSEDGGNGGQQQRGRMVRAADEMKQLLEGRGKGSKGGRGKKVGCHWES
jgi:hypothetical protein